MGKLSDLDYCYASIVLLEDLEKVSYARNERLRLFHEKARARRSVIVGALSAILPVVVWLYLLTSKVSIFNHQTFAIFGTRLIGLVMVTALLFILPYLFMHMICSRPFFRSFRRLFEKKLISSLSVDIKAIDAQATEIISKPILLEPRVPEAYLSVEFLTLLVRYFECGQASFMKEALYELKLELENTGYYASPKTHQTLLQREKTYLADEKYNLKIMVEKEEETYG
ncbi:hypothetical protein RyT2_17000 [Pseudolactococcus yaeyamensis]